MREGYGTWSVCVCVCVSVCQSGTTSPATTRNGTSNRRYLRLRRNLKKHFKYGVALFKSYGVKTLYVLTAQCLTATSYARAQAFENAHALTTMCEYTEGCGAKTETRTAVYNVE